MEANCVDSIIHRLILEMAHLSTIEVLILLLQKFNALLDSEKIQAILEIIPVAIIRGDP